MHGMFVWVCVSMHVDAYGPHICPQLIKPFLLSISVLRGMGLNHGYKIIKLFQIIKILFAYCYLFILKNVQLQVHTINC